MNLDDFNDITTLSPTEPRISVHDIEKTEGTLVYGYTCERNSFHVYVTGGEIHRLIYDHNNTVLAHTSGISEMATWLVPDKRVYPESVDAQFARLLLSRDVSIPFTRFDEARYEKVKDLTYHGKTHYIL